MNLINGRLDYTTAWDMSHVRLFTGNPIITKHGKVVMGAGAAKMVRDHYTGFDKVLGDTMTPSKLLSFVYTDNGYIGWAKVKHHWSHDAVLSLIKEMCEQLAYVAEKRPNLTFHMNYPGIGNGKLAVEKVQPLLDILPANVYIYK